MGNWDEIIPDLLFMIASRLHLFLDFLAFRGVCTSWRNAATKEYFLRKSQNQPPLLIMNNNEDEYSGAHNFYCLSNEKIHHVSLPELFKKLCYETLGWFVMQDRIDMGLELFHPFSRVRIPLPHSSTFYNPIDRELNWICKAVLSSSPSSINQNYVLVVIYGDEHRLASWRPKHQSWNCLKTSETVIVDVLFVGDKLFAVNCDGAVFVVYFDLDGFEKLVTVCASNNSYNWGWSKNYLVESKGAPCVLKIEFCPPSNSEDYIKVEAFEVDMNCSVLKTVDDLGCRAFFIGGNSASSSIDTCIFPAIKPNCVYCTYYMADRGEAISIYNLADGKKECCYKQQSHIITNSQMWVTPSF